MSDAVPLRPAERRRYAWAWGGKRERRAKLPAVYSRPAVLGSSFGAMTLVDSPGQHDGGGSSKSPPVPSRGAVLGARKSASIPMTPYVLPPGHIACAPSR
jgi:hypothetical protein